MLWSSSVFHASTPRSPWKNCENKLVFLEMSLVGTSHFLLYLETFDGTCLRNVPWTPGVNLDLLKLSWFRVWYRPKFLTLD